MGTAHLPERPRNRRPVVQTRRGGRPPATVTLVATLKTLVGDAPQGCFASELQRLLHVEVKDALLQLVQQGRIAREQVTGLFLYGSPDPAVRRRQLLARQALSEISGNASAEIWPEELKASWCCSPACWTSASAVCMPAWNS